MPAPAKIGLTYHSRMNHVKVVGYYRRWKGHEAGMLFQPVGDITSGIHCVAITIEEWVAEGFVEEGKSAELMARRRRFREWKA